MKNIKKMSIYDVNPRYFKDKTGNGIGDLEGMAQKFDYFDYLGVDAIILQDIIASHTDEERPKFTSINREVGDINGLQLVLSHAKKFGIQIYLEMKIGTITDKHAWFQNAIDNIEERGENIVEFSNKKDEVGTEGVKYSKDAKAYFAYNEKTREIPLNWKSDQVIDRFVDVIKFWNELGISGFVFKEFEFIGDKTKTELMNDSTLKDLRRFYRAIKEVNDDIVVIGKSHEIQLNDSSNYTSGATQVFDYFQSTRISKVGTYNKYGTDAPGTFNVKNLISRMKIYSNKPSNIVSFGTDEIGRFLSRWGDDKQYQKESAKSFALLSMLTPSSSTIYYADELGAKNIGLTHLDDFQDETLEERKDKMLDMKITEKEFMDAQVLQNPINARSLMMWNDKKNGGFGIAQQTITPPSNEYAENNVEIQFSDESSVLNFYKELNRIIHKSTYAPIVANGEWKISTNILSPGVVKMKSVYKTKEVIVFINLSDSDRKIFGAPKEGRVVLSTYGDKTYPEIPSKLQAYEGIVISKHTDDFIKETQMIKVKQSKEAARVKLEQLKLAEKERLEREREEIQRTQELQAKKEAAAAKRAATIAAKKAEQLAKETAAAERKAERTRQLELKKIKEAEEEEIRKQEAEKIISEETVVNKKIDLDTKNSNSDVDSDLIQEMNELFSEDETQVTNEVVETHEQEKSIEDKIIAKEKAKEERQAEKTRQFEMKLAAKEAKRNAKEASKEEREKEKTRQFEMKLARKEEKRIAKEKSMLDEIKENAKAEREAEKAAKQNASIMNEEVSSSDMTTLKESDIAPTTQIDVDDIDDIEEFLKNSK